MKVHEVGPVQSKTLHSPGSHHCIDSDVGAGEINLSRLEQTLPQRKNSVIQNKLRNLNLLADSILSRDSLVLRP